MFGLLAVAAGACAREDSAASGEAASEGPVPASRVVIQGSFRRLAAGAGQHLVVVTEAPGDVRGRLFRMERTEGGDPGESAGPGGGGESGEGVETGGGRDSSGSGVPVEGVSWRQAGAPIPVVVGRSGVGPKQEGDGRSPEGVFGLGTVFGYAEEPPAAMGVSAETRLRYEPMPPGAVCVDDVGSAYYTRVFDADTLPEAGPGAKDWASAEAMRRDLAFGDDLYRWGVVVQYNDAAVPGAGSCIFLHVWRALDSPTAGCTAMAEEDLLALLGWLKSGSVSGPEVESDLGPERTTGPLLVQGTRAYLEDLSGEGVLPYRIPPAP